MDRYLLLIFTKEQTYFSKILQNLISLGVQLKQDVRLYITDLRRIVENQWRKGMRKHLPLRVWMEGTGDNRNFAVFFFAFL